MKTTRHKVFETNSSSTHSITFNGESTAPSSDWVITWGMINATIETCPGEFGWGREDYNNFYVKLSYLVTHIVCHGEGPEGEHCQKLRETIKEYLNSELVIDADSEGHIDHQSVDLAGDILSGSKEYIANYLFNKTVTLIIDSDG